MLMLSLLVAGCATSQTNPGPSTARAPSHEPGHHDAREARPDDLRLVVSAPSPTGIVPADHTDEFPVHLDVTNESDDTVVLDDAIARVAVELEGEIPSGCEAPEVGAVTLAEDAGIRLEAGATTRFQVPLPCALTDLGHYDLLVSVLLAGEGEDFGAIAPTDPHLAASTRVDITEHDPPFGAHRPAVAEVP
ncbi:MAG: hypothetical protein SangKO_023520 [Sandaracinaceae bacterium]